MLLLTFILLIKKDYQANASLGDSFPSYKSCVDTCRLDYCEKGKTLYLSFCDSVIHHLVIQRWPNCLGNANSKCRRCLNLWGYFI